MDRIRNRATSTTATACSAVALCLTLAACETPGTAANSSSGGMAAMEHGAMAPSSETRAADLRVTLNQLLGEHVVLASSATNAALGGRQQEYDAAVAALDANSMALADAVGSVYGEGAGQAFLPLWRRHIGFFVDYTVASAGNDQAAQQQAVNNLVGYTEDFGAFINSANPALPKEAVAELVEEHVLALKAVVDAQAAGDQARAFQEQRRAYHHMESIANALAEGIVQQFPERFA